MEKEHKITITVDHIDKEYEVDEDQVINNDWNAIMADMLDSAKP